MFENYQLPLLLTSKNQLPIKNKFMIFFQLSLLITSVIIHKNIDSQDSIIIRVFLTLMQYSPDLLRAKDIAVVAEILATPSLSSISGNNAGSSFVQVNFNSIDECLRTKVINPIYMKVVFERFIIICIILHH